MTAHDGTRDGVGVDIEKGPYLREDARSDHDNTSTDDHSDTGHHDGFSHHDGDHDDDDDDDDEHSGPLTQPITREKTRNSRISRDLGRTASNVLSAVASRVTTRGWPEPPPPPDGGFQAWLQVGCGWYVKTARGVTLARVPALAIFVTWGYLNSFGSFQTYYEQTMPDTSPSVISWIGSLQIWLTMIMGIFTGRLLDAGFFVPTFFVGAVLQVLGLFLISICTKYWQLMLAQGVLTGLGGGIFFTPSLALVATYFSNRRGLAMGVVTTGNSCGGIVYPIVVRQLMPKLGFAWTTRVLGFINLGALSLCFCFMRPRLPPRKSGPLIDWAAFREPVWNTFVTGWWLLMWANYFTFYYIASFATESLGLTYSAATVLVIVVNGAGLPFRILVPLFSDAFGPLTAIAPVTLIWTVVAFAWLGVSTVPGYYVWTAFYGALSAAFQCLIPTAVASISPSLDKVGTRMGMAFGIISFASMTGPPVGGALLSADGGRFTGAQVWAACATLVGFGLCLTARSFKAGGVLNLRSRC